MSSNISRRSVWIVGMVALLVLGLSLTACGGAATPAAEAPAPTEEAAEAAPPVEDTPAAAKEPEPTDTPEEETTEASSPAESSTETEASSTDQEGTAAACLAADPNTDPLAGAILFLDEYIDADEINEGIPAVTDADWVKGPADAPITIIEFGDFQ